MPLEGAALDAAVESARAPQRLSAWRAVEAQHVVSTNALVDTLAEQAELERILEAAKPPLADAGALHYLLFTPFRYPPLPTGSRFRGPAEPGVWYGADAIRTACAELGYWRWRFLTASAELEALPVRAQSVFRATLAGEAIDLRRPPLVAERARWTDPADYGACQALARVARRAGLALVRYESVRDPEHGGCVAALVRSAFAAPAPTALETWLLDVRRARVTWASASPLAAERLEFRFSA